MKALLINRLLLALGFFGLFVSGFLSIAKVLSSSIPCGAAGGCDKLSNGPAGSWAGIPVAFVGVVGYLLLTAFAVARSLGGLEKTRKLIMPGYAVAAVGTAASLYLQYQALIVAHEVCLWCLASAFDMVISLILYAVLAQWIDDAPVGSLPSEPLGLPFSAGLAGALALSLIGSYAFLSKGPKIESAAPDPKIEIIPADAHILGDASSPVTIVEFADMYCPACRRISPQVKEYAAQHPGKIRLVYRHFPLLEKHPLAINAALISELAAEKGQFWNYLIGVMGREGEEEETLDELYDIASKVGVDPAVAKKRINDANDPIYAKVQRDMKAADSLKLTMTPTFLLYIKGKFEENASSNDILDKLKSPKYMSAMDGKSL